MLREIREWIGQGSRSEKEDWKTISDIVFTFPNEKDAFYSWVSSEYPSKLNEKGKRVFSFMKNVPGHSGIKSVRGSLLKVPVREAISRGRNFVVHLLDAESRLQIIKPPQAIDVHSEPHSHYIHALQADSDLLESISTELKAAFGKELMVNWMPSKVPLHVGARPNMPKACDRVSPEYTQALSNVPRLDEEGDGIKSFIGCLLAVECAPHKIILIDEPEAFLHPPQARRLGRLLAKNASKNSRQLIAATHSSDLVRGAVASGSRVSVLRLDREGNATHANLLSSDELESLWSKPLLRSSTAIEGIFHEGVVVCEADADCRFYESLLRRLEEKEVTEGPADLYFVHGGGKGELPTLCESYRRLGVPVCAIADFDMLRSKGLLKKLISALGGNFQNIKSEFHSVSDALADLPPTLGLENALDEARTLIDEIEHQDSVSGQNQRELSELLSDARDWSEAKKYGYDKLRGGKRQECEKLLRHLQDMGLFIVPTGEMESWNRSLPASKSEWIREALQLINDDWDAFRDAEEFVCKLSRHLGVEVDVT